MQELRTRIQHKNAGLLFNIENQIEFWFAFFRSYLVLSSKNNIFSHSSMSSFMELSCYTYQRMIYFTAWLTMQETRSIHDSMNIPKIKVSAYIYILLLIPII